MKMTASSRALDKIYKRRDRYQIPDWQRDKVWDLNRKQQLIDSILRGWKLPKFYFLKVSDEDFQVVDGQQRLNALFEFLDGALSLSAESVERYGASHYRELPGKLSDAFDDFEIEFDVIEEADEDELKGFFQRLQQGLPLTASERLNSVPGGLRDFCRGLAAHALFTEKVAFADTRFAHFDVASKSAVVELEGLDSGLRFEDMKAVFQEHRSLSGKSAAAKRLNETLAFLDRAFPAKCPLLKNRSVVQSFITLAAKLVATRKAKGRERSFRDFAEQFLSELARQVELGAAATDADYLRFQRTVNSNIKAGALTRHEILLRKLFMLKPELAELFDPSAVIGSGVTGRISELADEIARLIEQINTVQHAKDGTDFFKPTSRTTLALTRLRKPIRSVSDYGRLVDDLYFVFREGPGDRLRDRWPPSFLDVNALRTERRHDVDHGAKSKVKAKRRKAAGVFAKSSGVTSPEGADPSRFPLAHANLLTAIEQDLKALLAGPAA